MSDEPKVYVVWAGEEFNGNEHTVSLLGVFSTKEKAENFLARYPESNEYRLPEIEEFTLDELEDITLIYRTQIMLGSGVVQVQMPQVLEEDDRKSDYTGSPAIRESFPPSTYASVWFASRESQEAANTKAKTGRSAWLKEKVKEIQ